MQIEEVNQSPEVAITLCSFESPVHRVQTQGPITRLYKHYTHNLSDVLRISLIKAIFDSKSQNHSTGFLTTLHLSTNVIYPLDLCTNYEIFVMVVFWQYEE